MDKITLKELAPYLPYGLTGIITEWPQKKVKVTMTGIRGELIYFGNKFESTFTPFLRPLSSLTKEITHNGETFVPVIKLCKIIADIHNDDLDEHWVIKDDGRILVTAPWDLRITIWYKGDSIQWSVYNTWDQAECRVHNPISAVSKLHEWHFDISGLISRGLALPMEE